MHDSQGGIALPNIFNQYPECSDVENIFEPLVLALHLSPDAVNMFRSARDRCVDALFPQCFLERSLDLSNKFLAPGPFLVQRRCYRLVLNRVGKSKGEVFEFPLELPDTQSIGERSVDFSGFECNSALL